jgi:membrane protein implicated in regulation of membrane protease activity
MNGLSPSAIWFIIGFILLLLEFAMPGLIIFFFGLGAWVVACTLLFSDISFNSQLLLFIISSVASVLLFRKGIRKMLHSRPGPDSIIEDEFKGKTAIAETDITPGKNGKVVFNGTSWGASSSDHILAGENVIITGNESIVLIVRSTKIA